MKICQTREREREFHPPYPPSLWVTEITESARSFGGFHLIRVKWSTKECWSMESLVPKKKGKEGAGAVIIPGWSGSARETSGRKRPHRGGKQRPRVGRGKRVARTRKITQPIDRSAEPFVRLRFVPLSDLTTTGRIGTVRTDFVSPLLSRRGWCCENIARSRHLQIPLPSSMKISFIEKF